MSTDQVIHDIATAEREWRVARAFFELASVAVGSISGAIHAIRREYDLIGITVIGVTAGLGGGIVRDLFIGQGPVLALRHPLLLLTALVAAAVGIVLGPRIANLRIVFWFFEAFSVGLFTLVGIQRAEEIGLRLVPALFLGVLSGTGGGLLRDVLCRETPAVLVPGTPYAAAALFGGCIYFTSRLGLGWPVLLSEWLALLAAFALRAFGTWRRWIVPRRSDVTSRLKQWRSARSSRGGNQP